MIMYLYMIICLHTPHFSLGFSSIQASVFCYDVESKTSLPKRIIVPLSTLHPYELTINARAMMLVAEAYPSTLPLMLHIFAMNMQLPERLIKVRSI